MKQLLFTLIAVLALCANAAAENYPYRSDYLWVTVPDHADWLYDKGERAKVEVQLYRYGVPVDGEVSYEIADDMMPSDRKGTAKLKQGRALIDIGTRATPGFRDLRLSANVGGKTYKHHIKLGFSVDEIRPVVKEPSDFLDFWNGNIADMRAFPLSYTKEKAEEYCTDKVDCYLLKIQLNKQKQSVYAYLFYPKNAKKGSCPAVLCPPGAGIKTIKEPLRHKYYAENGCIRMEMEIHGIDPRLPKAAFDDMTRAFNGRENGYLYNGLEDRDRYYMKRVYLALVRCLDLLTALPEWDGRNLIVQGGSQGGALSIVAAALDSRVTQCIVNHPALSDMAAYAAGHTVALEIPGKDISQEMGEANQALIQALFMETVLALVPEGTGESASWRLIEDPGQVSEEVWRASQAPMLLLCREDAPALLERLTATQTTVLQLLETSQLP